ncbi:hypothetical protein CL647_06535 [bacterium]|nr:hypothetical protein [bacterium]
MSADNNNVGIYNDIDNEWMLYAARNAWIQLHYNGSAKLETMNEGIKAHRFYDWNNTGYYIDPASTSYLNDVRAYIFYDKNDTNYRIDPNGTSYVNDLRANIIYDKNDTNYRVDPNGQTRLNEVCIRGDCKTSWPGGSSNGGNIYKDRYYDNNNHGYYMDPASTSRMNDLDINRVDFSHGSSRSGADGELLRRNGQAQIFFDDWLYFSDSNNGNEARVRINVDSRRIYAYKSNPSDRRWKENIRDMSSILDNFMTLKPRVYDHKKDDQLWIESEGDQENKIVNPDNFNVKGFIAQEIKEVFPDAVTQDTDGYYYVDSDPLASITIKAVQEVKNEKDNEVAKINEKLSALEAKLDKLVAANEAKDDTIQNLASKLEQLSMQFDAYAYNPSSYSDKTLKVVQEEIKSTLDKLVTVGVYKYQWKDHVKPKSKYQLSESHVGVLAQDIKLLFPELVTTDSNGKQQVDMPGLTAVLIQSVKELQSSHQLELDTLKAENKAIKKQLKTIKGEKK